MIQRKATWTEDEIAKLRSLSQSGASHFIAAAALKRRVSTIRAKAQQLGCPFPPIRDHPGRIAASRNRSPRQES